MRNQWLFPIAIIVAAMLACSLSRPAPDRYNLPTYTTLQSVIVTPLTNNVSFRMMITYKFVERSDSPTIRINCYYITPSGERVNFASVTPSESAELHYMELVKSEYVDFSIQMVDGKIEVGRYDAGCSNEGQDSMAATSFSVIGNIAPPAKVVTSTLTAGATITINPPSAPTNYQEFSNLSELQKASKLPLWLPADIPDNLPFLKGSMADYANGDQAVSLLYSEPGDPLDANLKSIAIQMTRTDESLSRDSLTHQFKIIALDVQQVQVRGLTGFTYWTRSGAAGNSTCLVWRAGNLNFLITLWGNWPQPDENNPHGLDVTLVKVADSLQSGK